MLVKQYNNVLPMTAPLD